MGGPQVATRSTAVLAGLGGWLPPRVVDNVELTTRLDTTDAWIRSRTGIAERRVVDDGVSTVDMAVEAGARALRSAGTEHVDAVVLATATPDQPCPASAPQVATRLGQRDVAAFDVGAVCSGFLYALATAAGLIAGRIAQEVLVVGSDAFTTLIDPADRGTVPIFGDGAGAVVLRAGDQDEPGALGPFDLHSDGDGTDLLVVPAGGSRQKAAREPGEEYLRMEGPAVFRHATARMAESSRVVLGELGWTVGDVDRFVGHQANIRILNTVAKQLGLPADSLVVNIDRTGNTSAASIPLALADGVRDGSLQAGDRVLLAAFGAGLTWGATAMRWPDLTVEEVA
nr:beta-ketoacyl-ACP synthase III [Prauserella isguenensis]